MTSAQIISIGTELLLGEIQDTNSQFLAVGLRNAGYDLFRIILIGDNQKRISEAIQQAMQEFDIVITTGGLGPTIDDPTRIATSDALGIPLVFHQDLWNEISARFSRLGRQPTENNRLQAYIPIGSTPILNPVGTAPGFILYIHEHVLICLPGVPGELKIIFTNFVIPWLKNHFPTDSHLFLHTIHVSGLGESTIDDLISDLEKSTNPTVGLLAHPGQVDIRIAVKAKSSEKAKDLLTPYFKIIKQRIGDSIYGMDEITLPQTIDAWLTKFPHCLVIVEDGLIPPLSSFGFSNKPLPLISTTKTIHFLISLKHPLDFSLSMTFQSDHHIQSVTYQYAGPQENSQLWAMNTALDYLRRNLLEINRI